MTPLASGASIARCDTGISDHVVRSVAQLGRAPGLGPGGFAGPNPAAPTETMELVTQHVSEACTARCDPEVSDHKFRGVAQ